jgi:multidrug efflux pump subunit AcrA (membrane-fusion protein)
MPHVRGWIAGLLLVSSLLSGCAAVADEEAAMDQPAALEAIEGSDVPRITLTADAAQRVDIRTGPTRATESGVVMPYAALFYTASGETWVYTSPEPLTYLRMPVVVDRIRGERVFLSAGLTPGMNVVTQGTAELYGTETDVEE